jgi:hypothetical protein
MCTNPSAPKQQAVAPAQTPAPLANPENTANSNTAGGQRAASTGRNALRIDLNTPASSASGLAIPQ